MPNSLKEIQHWLPQIFSAESVSKCPNYRLWKTSWDEELFLFLKFQY